jgi:hypothetical protein
MKGAGMVRARFLLLSTVMVAAWFLPTGPGASLVHRPVQEAASAQRASVTSTNWSGYADQTATFSDVKGSWTQPAVSCARRQSAYASFWVGIDGYASSSVEQIGTDSDCSYGRPVYYAWYEMYPAGSVSLSQRAYPVVPGDVLTAEVSSSGATFTLTLSDVTRTWTFTTVQQSSTAAKASAEWVVEAPSSCVLVCRTLPLSNFRTVNFSGSSTTGNGITRKISGFADTEVVMTTATGVVKAQPTPLTRDGTAFGDTWAHS